MATTLNYFSTVQPDALASAMTNSVTSVVLAAGDTYPDPAQYGGIPYTVILAYGTSREEICTVTAKPTSTTLTVIRGQDGTPATSKNAGDVVVHGVSAREFKAIADKVNRSGDTMTGFLTLNAAPTSAAHAATKKYVDDEDDADRLAAQQYADSKDVTTLASAKNYTDGQITTVNSAMALKAPLASPALTGLPTAPTQATADLSTRIATTSFVHSVADASAAAQVVNESTGSSTVKAMSQDAAKKYSDGKVINALGTATGAAPSQAAVNSGLAGKANAFKSGRAGPYTVPEHGTTNDLTINHGLGRLPTAVFITVDGDGGDATIFATVASFDATKIVAHMNNTGGASTGVRLSWMAL